MKTKKLSQESIRTIFSILNTFVILLIFVVALNVEYENVNYLLYGSTLTTFIYLFFLIVSSRIFEMNRIGEARVYDLFLSLSLATFISNIMIYMVVCLVAIRRLSLLPIIGVQIIDEFVCANLLYFENRYIRDSYPIPKAIAIFGEPNYEILEKIYKYRDILVTVNKKVDISQIDFKHLDNYLDGYERVITIDVDHNLKKIIFKKCYEKQIVIYDVPSISDTLIASSSVMHVIDTPILKIGRFGPTYLESIVKRLIDVVGSLVLIILTSPIMICVAIAIKAQDGGSPLYKQTRLTKNGKKFKIYKFRSMILNAEKFTGAMLSTEDDPRITKIGKFIRKTRFDELPQLFNILKGDMTFVGPRPERPELFKEITKEIPEFKYRLNVKAGLTGYAQIYGKYNTSMRDKILLDLYYIENYSLIDDIKLLIMTLKIVFMPESTEGVKKDK